MLKFEQQKKKTYSIEDLVSLTKDDMAKVNALILKNMSSDVDIIPLISDYLISSGGKRLRPMLTLASAALFGYQGEKHVQLAMAVEFMHTATLLHDDVVDESDLRRGKITACKMWGNQESVLVGDFLLGRAFKVMVEVGSLCALEILSSAAVVIAEGEVMQLANANNIATEKATYLKIIEAKTAVLFSAACEVGAIIADAGPQARLALKNYGAHLGMAFQLVDDVLDYVGDVTLLGKNVGDDFRDGKITLPFMLCYQQATDQERRFLADLIKNKTYDDQHFDQTINLIKKYKALEKTIELARFYGIEASNSLSSLEDSPAKQALLELVEFCIARLS